MWRMRKRSNWALGRQCIVSLCSGGTILTTVLSSWATLGDIYVRVSSLGSLCEVESYLATEGPARGGISVSDFKESPIVDMGLEDVELVPAIRTGSSAKLALCCSQCRLLQAQVGICRF